MKKNRLTIFIIIAMALGVIVGYMVHVNSSPEYIKKFADNIKLLTTIFLRLVQMIIAPLVFCTLVVGIAKLGDLKSVGRVGGKAMLWFVSASLVSLLLGLLLVNLFQPGGYLITVQRPHRKERLQHHQVERPLKDVGFPRLSVWHANRVPVLYLDVK